MPGEILGSQFKYGASAQDAPLDKSYIPCDVDIVMCHGGAGSRRNSYDAEGAMSGRDGPTIGLEWPAREVTSLWIRSDVAVD